MDTGGWWREMRLMLIAIELVNKALADGLKHPFHMLRTCSCKCPSLGGKPEFGVLTPCILHLRKDSYGVTAPTKLMGKRYFASRYHRYRVP